MNQLQVKQEAEDIAKLKKARILAISGKIENLRSAIDQVNIITSDKKYEEAQQLISDIKNRIQKFEDTSYLQQAKKLALKNDVISLQLAISQASIISRESYLHKEANKNIEQWRDKISHLTDKPQQPQQKIITKTNNLKELEDLQLNEISLDSVSENSTATFSSL